DRPGGRPGGRVRRRVVAEAPEERLAGNRLRVVARRADAGVGEVLGEGVAAGGADGVLVVDVASPRPLRREHEGQPPEPLRVAAGDAAARRRPRLEVTELDAQDGGLQLVEAARPPQLDVVVLLDLAVVAEAPEPPG